MGAGAADPARRVLYLTEDEADGKFYRFVSTTWGDLSAGTLQVFRAGAAISGTFTWATVPDPDGSPTPTRQQDRLYFSSQHGTTGSFSGGITYCVTGPFRR